MLTLLRELVDVPGGAGSEEKVAAAILRHLGDLPLEKSIDPMGNLILKIAGTEPRGSIMICVHMDEVSLAVRHIQENGRLSFSLNGLIDMRTLVSTQVDVHSKVGSYVGVIGTKGSHLVMPDERARPLGVESLWLDIGARSRQQVEAMGIKPGDLVTYRPNFCQMSGGYIVSKAIDNRAGCAIVVDLARKLSGTSLPFDLYLVAAVQEEVGARGSKVAAQRINPTMAVVVDTTPAADPLTKPHEVTCEVGQGPIIRVMDMFFDLLLGTIYSKPIREWLVEAAERLRLPYQATVASTFSDAATVHLANQGVPCGGVFIARLCSHSATEVAHIEDIENTSALLCEALRGMTGERLQEIGLPHQL